ncbi:MAG TPA: acyl-CoA thioester hydrolase/BAAT C-terminal domain-containing protein, partial [Gammaproteobacteria bacterium]|nr:acyl-CoA thioester hydrolase/BAAT C-terminal domain-containing protein [Gammaproteobacteria bacterium]
KARSSWTLGGKPLLWVNFVADPAAFAKGGPIAFAPSYAAGLRDSAAVARAAIPVERIGGPVLLVSAGDDQIWPSSVMARHIMQRLRSRRHPYANESLCYAAAGHLILPPYRPTNANATSFAAGSILFGGEPQAYAFADVDAWQKSLAFLARLTTRPGP